MVESSASHVQPMRITHLSMRGGESMKFILAISKYHHDIKEGLIIDDYIWLNIETIAEIGNDGYSPKTFIRTTLGKTYYYNDEPTKLVVDIEERFGK
jgi:hypothetical protein